VHEVVSGLELHPELGAIAEVVGKAKGCIGRDAAAPQHDLVDAPGRHTKIYRQPVLAEPVGSEELFREDLTGVDGR